MPDAPKPEKTFADRLRLWLLNSTYRYTFIALAIISFFLPLLFVSPIPGKSGAYMFKASYEQHSTSIAVGVYHCAIPDDGGTIVNPDNGEAIYVSAAAPTCNSLHLSFLNMSEYVAVQVFLPLSFVTASLVAAFCVYLGANEKKNEKKIQLYTILAMTFGVLCGCFTIGFSAVTTYNANVKYGVYLTIGGAYWFCIIFGTVMMMIATMSFIMGYDYAPEKVPAPFKYFRMLSATSKLGAGLFLTSGLLLLCCLFTGYISGKNGAFIFRAYLEDDYSVVIGPYYCSFPDLYINFSPPYGKPVSLNPANTYCRNAKFSFMRDDYHIATGVFLALALTSTLICILIICYTVAVEKDGILQVAGVVKRDPAIKRKIWRPRILYVLFFSLICCSLALAFSATVTYHARLNHDIRLTIGGAYWACLIIATVLIIGCILSFLMKQKNFTGGHPLGT